MQTPPYQRPARDFQPPSGRNPQPSQPYQHPYQQPGYALGQMRAGAPMSAAGQKDRRKTLLLCLFLGVVGVHRFYTGQAAIDVIQLLTLGGCGIWTLIDLVTIATNTFTDANGQPLLKK